MADFSHFLTDTLTALAAERERGMWHHRIIPGITALCLITGSIARANDGHNTVAPRKWLHSYKEARQESQRLGLPLIVHFHTSWCGPCRQMEKEFLGTSAMQELLGEKFVGVKLDGDQNEWLVDAFRVSGYPGDVVVAPDGKILLHTSGRRSKSQYFAMLESTRNRHRDVLKKARAVAIAQLKPSTQLAEKPRQKSLQNPPRPEEVTRPELLEPEIPRKSEALLVGLEGYSPVAITTKRQWVRGRQDLAVTHQGVVYYLANEDEHRKFKVAPRQYVPRMLGCDPVQLWQSDDAVQGTVRYGAFYEQKLYLFVSSDTRNEFKRDPVKYVQMRHAIQSDEISGTRLR